MIDFLKKMLLGALVLVLGAAPGAAEIVDRIVAVVNEDIITLSDLNTAFEPYQRRIEQTLSGAERDKVIAEGRREILNQLVDGKLIEQQAKRSGITVKDDEVDQTINDILKRRNVSMAEFLKVLEREGETMESYRHDIRNQLLRQRLIRREVQSKIVVSDEEIGEYYRQHREDYEGKEAVRVRQIFIPIPRGSDDRAVKRLREEAEEVRRKIVAGEPFELFAAKYAPNQSLAAAGGDIGFIERGAVLPEVEEAAFRLKVDEVSGVIAVENGFYILKVTDKRGAGLKPIQEVRQEIVAKIEEKKMARRFDEWMAEVRKKAYIEIRL
ncbi:MAG TPA: SurA N-terminal domain-containing protein [Syntrophales bacterium]|nr:SurA N-terminal domain-containing protein [Syntrophales bacterium]HPC00617.1 SurA N-terminal domain-containing protein [Syntrophales bacterium]